MSISSTSSSTLTTGARTNVIKDAVRDLQRHEKPRRRLLRHRTAYLFLLPYFLVTIVFFLYPLGYATVLSFHQTAGPGRRAFVGWSNFSFILNDPDFHKALINTAIFTICSLFLQLPLSLGLAMLLNARKDRMKGFFRLALFSPNLVGQVFVGILFIRQVPELVMPAIVIASLWLWVGFNMIYFLAALQNVDQNLIDAARIDGAGPGRIFLHVTVPAIMPVATFVVVTSTIGSLQLFELPYTLLEQNFGPKNSGLTIVGYLYNQGINTGDFGLGAAVGWLLTFLILGVSLLQIKLSGTLRRDA